MKIIRIDLTDNCNFRCIMCQGHKLKKKTDVTYLSFDEFSKNTMGALFSYNIIIGHTAEPTIHPDFEVFVDFIRSQTEENITILTNGSMLHNHMKCLVRNQCTIHVSIDSLDEVTWGTIRVGGNLKRILLSMDEMKDAGLEIHLSTTFMKRNVGEFKDLVYYCKGRGFIFNFFPMATRVIDGVLPLTLLSENLIFNKKELRALIELVDRDFLNKHGCGTNSDLNSKAVNECRVHNEHYYIDSSGNLFVCSGDCFGNVIENGLSQIMASKKLLGFHRLVEETRKPCNDCSYLKRCITHSLRNTMVYYDDNIYSLLDKTWKKRLYYSSDEEDCILLKDFIRYISKWYPVVHYEQSGNVYQCILISGEEKFDPSNRDALASYLSENGKKFETSNMYTLNAKISAYVFENKLRKLTGKKIFIWGTGQNYKDNFSKWVNKNKQSVLGFIDNNSSTWGLKKNGFKIYAPSYLQKVEFDALIIASTFRKEITEQIIEMNLSEIERVYKI